MENSKLVSVQDFARRSGLMYPSKVIEKIHKGEIKGKIIDGKWYVEVYPRFSRSKTLTGRGMSSDEDNNTYAKPEIFRRKRGKDKPKKRMGILGLALVGISMFLGWITFTPSTSLQNPGIEIKNAKFASPHDVRLAEEFLRSLPSFCSSSYAYASRDGSVNIRIICRNNERSMTGLISFKNGVMTRIE